MSHRRTFKTYNEYLASRRWAKKRAKYLERTSRRTQGRIMCKLCFSYGPIEIHHKTYARVGRESLNDLIGLCPDCHEMVHELGPRVVKSGEAKLPTMFKAVKKNWMAHVNRNKMWDMRASDPAGFKRAFQQFALDFYCNTYGLGTECPF